MIFSRRHFCRLTALASISLMLMPKRALATTQNRSLRGSCRIEVLRCNCFTELQSRYLDDPEAGPCSRFKVGEKFIIDARSLKRFEEEKCPFCRQAWNALRPYVMAALSAGETTECAPASAQTQAVIACPDGTRPVIFKVTAC